MKPTAEQLAAFDEHWIEEAVPILYEAAMHGIDGAHGLLVSCVERSNSRAAVLACECLGKLLLGGDRRAKDAGIDYLFRAVLGGSGEALDALIAQATKPRRGKCDGPTGRLRQWRTWTDVVRLQVDRPTRESADFLARLYSIGSPSIVAGLGELIGLLRANPLCGIDQRRLLADLLCDRRFPWFDSDEAAELYEELAKDGDETSMKRLMMMSGQNDRLHRLRQDPRWATWPAKRNEETQP